MTYVINSTTTFELRFRLSGHSHMVYLFLMSIFFFSTLSFRFQHSGCQNPCCINLVFRILYFRVKNKTKSINFKGLLLITIIEMWLGARKLMSWHAMPLQLKIWAHSIPGREIDHCSKIDVLYFDNHSIFFSHDPVTIHKILLKITCQNLESCLVFSTSCVLRSGEKPFKSLLLSLIIMNVTGVFKLHIGSHRRTKGEEPLLNSDFPIISLFVFFKCFQWMVDLVEHRHSLLPPQRSSLSSISMRVLCPTFIYNLWMDNVIYFCKPNCLFMFLAHLVQKGDISQQILPLFLGGSTHNPPFCLRPTGHCTTGLSGGTNFWYTNCGCGSNFSKCGGMLANITFSLFLIKFISQKSIMWQRELAIHPLKISKMKHTTSKIILTNIFKRGSVTSFRNLLQKANLASLEYLKIPFIISDGTQFDWLSPVNTSFFHPHSTFISSLFLSLIASHLPALKTVYSTYIHSKRLRYKPFALESPLNITHIQYNTAKKNFLNFLHDCEKPSTYAKIRQLSIFFLQCNPFFSYFYINFEMQISISNSPTSLPFKYKKNVKNSKSIFLFQDYSYHFELKPPIKRTLQQSFLFLSDLSISIFLILFLAIYLILVYFFFGIGKNSRQILSLLDLLYFKIAYTSFIPVYLISLFFLQSFFLPVLCFIFLIICLSWLSLISIFPCFSEFGWKPFNSDQFWASPYQEAYLVLRNSHSPQLQPFPLIFHRYIIRKNYPQGLQLKTSTKHLLIWFHHSISYQNENITPLIPINLPMSPQLLFSSMSLLIPVYYSIEYVNSENKESKKNKNEK
ncbi:hypothetical protein VP01_2194g4 [Puccinia sorghi]|uniref:Uncharacterized protein n=1 Tax=Puccinia sorghi TaxID=27349 RepID=A0A0L6V909_9BASI|nr:hypothetical protein VP01_2194g4 [Puccinia sorghi]